jgi:hypothetical protein
MSPISLNPTKASEGGGEFPRGNMEITSARFGIHEFRDRDGQPVKSRYGEGTVAPSMAAILELTNVDTGTVFADRVYTIGAPSRYTISSDGESLMDGEELNVNCNFMKLMNTFMQLGYPVEKFDEAGGNIVTALVGLVALWDQTTDGSGNVSKNISPMTVHRYPWEGSTNGVTPAPTPTRPKPVPEPVPAGTDMIQVGVQVAQGLLASDPDSATRQKLASSLFLVEGDYTADQLTGLVKSIYEQVFVDALAEVGISLNGETLCQS